MSVEILIEIFSGSPVKKKKKEKTLDSKYVLSSLYESNSDGSCYQGCHPHNR